MVPPVQTDAKEAGCSRLLESSCDDRTVKEIMTISQPLQQQTPGTSAGTPTGPLTVDAASPPSQKNVQPINEEIAVKAPAEGGYGHDAYEPKGFYMAADSEVTLAKAEGKQISERSIPVNSSAVAEVTRQEAKTLAGTNLADEAVIPEELPVIADPLFLLEHLEGVIPPEADILQHDVDLLHRAHHKDPFSVLGPHFFRLPNEEIDFIVVRVWRKDAGKMWLKPIPQHNFAFRTASEPLTPAEIEQTRRSDQNPDEFVPMTRRADWLYQAVFRVVPTDAAKKLASDTTPTADQLNALLHRTRFIYDLRVQYQNDSTNKIYSQRDAYNFGLVAAHYDLVFFQKGSCWHVDNLMGSHIVKIDGVQGVRFVVWAPAAQFVSVVGDFNQWDGRVHPMRRRVDFGIWELFVPLIGSGEKYSYRIHTRGGHDMIKIDPYAQEFENPPATASIVSACDDAYKPKDDRFSWTDGDWIARRNELAKKDLLRRQPMSIYEVHLPSWMRGDGNTYLKYRELAHRLIAHVKKMNFTHVEFLPLAHHPFEGSWGYQVSGLYAPYSRLGDGDDLKYLVNELHKNDIGVIVDFVPAHFVKDEWALVHYDGTPCYEYADPREGEHKGWGTMVYNFRRNEVRSFLLGAAYHWLRRYHLDGLRIDAVSSMIYKNHCREDGDWLPNEFGGDANLQAISLLQEMNWVIHHEFPGVVTMAEESTSWGGVTDKEKGLGFDLKWDLGWMNDSLSYLCTPSLERWKSHNKLTFRGLYMAHERWVLPLSHDEVVSGKGSLLDKCGFKGTPFEERLRTLRALYGFQIGQPGRPLLFMGGEFGQGREWRESSSLDWHEAQEDARKKHMHFVSDLLEIYRTELALHAGDDESWNFQWVDCDNATDNMVAFLRKFGHWSNDILIIVNFANVRYQHYPLGVPHGGPWTCLINSDDWKYGGNQGGPGKGVKQSPTQGGRMGWPYCLWMDIPACAVMIFKAPEMSPEESSASADANAAASRSQQTRPEKPNAAPAAAIVRDVDELLVTEESSSSQKENV